MRIEILRDPEQAQRFLLQGLWLQRTSPPVASTVKPILEWAIEIAASGQPLLPLGVIADLGHAAYGADRDPRATREQSLLPGLPPTLMRTYEDHVLGKVYADWSFERASDAMRRFQGRDRAIGLAYLIRQFRDRAGLGGVELSPGVIRGLLEVAARRSCCAAVGIPSRRMARIRLSSSCTNRSLPVLDAWRKCSRSKT